MFSKNEGCNEVTLEKVLCEHMLLRPGETSELKLINSVSYLTVPV
jgi:hypothetical protein